MERPQAPGSATVKGSNYRPEDLNPELARLKAIRKYMKKSGNLSRTSKKQQVYTGILKAFRKQGFDTTPMIDAFEEIDRLSPDLNGMSRTELLALLSPPKLVIPGIGQIGAPFQEEKPGFFATIWGKITGKDPNQQQTGSQ